MVVHTTILYSYSPPQYIVVMNDERNPQRPRIAHGTHRRTEP